MRLNIKIWSKPSALGTCKRTLGLLLTIKLTYDKTHSTININTFICEDARSGALILFLNSFLIFKSWLTRKFWVKSS